MYLPFCITNTNFPLIEKKSELCSSNGHPARIKFSNGSRKVVASIDWVDTQGNRKHIKDIQPRKAWIYDTMENHVFVAYQKGRKGSEMALNCGWFWKVVRPHNSQFVEKILITEGNIHFLFLLYSRLLK